MDIAFGIQKMVRENAKSCLHVQMHLRTRRHVNQGLGTVNGLKLQPKVFVHNIPAPLIRRNKDYVLLSQISLKKIINYALYLADNVFQLIRLLQEHLIVINLPLTHTLGILQILFVYNVEQYIQIKQTKQILQITQMIQMLKILLKDYSPCSV